MLYTLVCPNAFYNVKRGKSVTTSFTYDNLPAAEKHKFLCDQWDIGKGEPPKSYIVAEEG